MPTFIDSVILSVSTDSPIMSERSVHSHSSRDEARLIDLWANTPKPCSCWMCGNPRKDWNEKSVQERMAISDHSSDW